MWYPYERPGWASGKLRIIPPPRREGQPINVSALTSPPPPGILILSADCVARARAEMALLHGEGAANWLAHAVPKAVVGHAYYVYEFR